MNKVYYLNFFLILTSLLLSCSDDESNIGTHNNYQNFRKSDIGYIQYYIPKNYLYFSNVILDNTPDSLEVKIRFHQTYHSDAILEFEGKPNQKIVSGEYLSLKFLLGSDELISKSLKVKIVSGSELLASENIVINFYPKQLYLNSSNTAPGYIIIQKYDKTEIPFISQPHDAWTAKTPSEEDIAFAKAEWGHLVENILDPFEKAKIIQKAIIKKLENFQGTPSDELSRLKPFDQYRRLIEGNDKLWCSNWTKIYSHALLCFDFKVRRVIFGNFLQVNQEPNVLLAEGHTSMEVFDSNNFSWKVIDLTFYLLEAYYQNQPLNILDLYYMINNPMYVENIELLEYDPVLDREYRIKLIDSQYSAYYFNYFKLNQQFTFKKL